METISIIISFLSAIVSSFVAFFLYNKVIAEKKYNTKNGIELLKIGEIETWNELRLKNPSWYPSLEKENLASLDLDYADFSNLVLNNANLSNSRLTNCNFEGVSATNANFSLANLSNSNFEKANLTGSVFTNAKLKKLNLTDAILVNTGLEPIETQTKEPERLIDIESREFLNHIDNLSPWEFEKMIAELFEVLGYEVTLSTRNIDNGVDMMITDNDQIDKQVSAVQVKKYNPNNLIGVNIIRQILYTIDTETVNRGILVTSSRLTRGARQAVENNPRIKVIDRESLLNLFKKLKENDA